MEILQLKYFCDAAVTENFSQTAKNFMVPPSAVSQSIKRLENELGTTLFKRQKNKITLNDDGKIFFEAVSKSGQIISDAIRKITENKNELSGEIKLQILCNRNVVSDAIKEFKTLYPGVSFILSHETSSDKHFDLIISDDSYPNGNYLRQKLITEDIAIAFSKEHSLNKQNDISLENLADEYFITMDRSSRLYYFTQKVCSDAGFTPKIAIECDDPYYIRKYIAMGLGIGFVPAYSWRGQFSDNIVLKKLNGITRTSYVYCNQSSYVTKSSEHFMDFLIDYIKNS